MEHEHALTQAIGADFEPGSVGRERVIPDAPLLRRFYRCVYDLVTIGIPLLWRVMARIVIEDHFEHPMLCAFVGIGNGWRGPRLVGTELRQIGLAVAVEDALEVSVRGSQRICL